MPLTDIGSYPSVMDEFSAHWDDVNTSLGGTPATDLKLAGAFIRTQFISLRTDVQGKITAEVGLQNARQLLATSRDMKKVSLRDRLSQWRGMLRAVFPQTKYVSAAPLLPDLTASESKFMAAFDDAADLWARIDADMTIPGFTPPLTIAGYARTGFVGEIAALRADYSALTTAENDLQIGQQERDALLPIARERMVQYRAAVPALLGPNHPLSLSLPDLFPAPGSTPDPVVLSGGWNGTANAAIFNWTASTHTNLDEYELRMSPGATYDAATATVVGNIPPGTTTFQTTAGLTNAGDVAAFRIFVKLTTGNEAGSNTITITRP